MQRPISIIRLDSALAWSWLVTVSGDAAVTFGPPSPDGGPSGAAARASRGINLHLLSIAPAPEAPLRGERRIELQIALRYLATSWAEERDAADLLCTLVFHLLSPGVRGPDQQGEIALETAPPPQEVLSALGLPPRPAVVLQVPLFHVEEPPFAPRVTEAPYRSRTGIAEGLRGRLGRPR